MQNLIVKNRKNVKKFAFLCQIIFWQCQIWQSAGFDPYRTLKSLKSTGKYIPVTEMKKAMILIFWHFSGQSMPVLTLKIGFYRLLFTSHNYPIYIEFWRIFGFYRMIHAAVMIFQLFFASPLLSSFLYRACIYDRMRCIDYTYEQSAASKDVQLQKSNDSKQSSNKKLC